MNEFFLLVDLDGTIRRSKSGKTFINDPEDQEPIEGATGAIDHFDRRGWNIVGVTNQAGVAAGHKTLTGAIEEQRITLKLFPALKCIYFCPDFEGLKCYRVDPDLAALPHDRLSADGGFRKPDPGMVRLALRQWLPADTGANVWMVGDRPEDGECAANAGISFCPASAWRARFLKGVQTLEGLSISQVRFLEGL
jgi:D-glycero-D-manno-heptose 1,7-bisphosphate phosphatase